MNFRLNLQVEPVPKWYWILNIFAIGFIVTGFIEAFRWFNIWQRLCRS
jgi:hypothetical protein